MYMIFDTTNDDRWCILIPTDSSHVSVKLFALLAISQPWLPMLGGEDEVNIKLHERLRHGLAPVMKCNPFRVAR